VIWNIDTGPLVMLPPKPKLLKEQVSNHTFSAHVLACAMVRAASSAFLSSSSVSLLVAESK